MAEAAIKHPRPAPEKRAKRPYRFWNPYVGKYFKWRYYTHRINAMRAAFGFTKWLPLDTTVEVLDIRSMKLEGQYTRREENIKGKPTKFVEFRGENQEEVKQWETSRKEVGPLLSEGSTQQRSHEKRVNGRAVLRATGRAKTSSHRASA